HREYGDRAAEGADGTATPAVHTRRGEPVQFARPEDDQAATGLFPRVRRDADHRRRCDDRGDRRRGWSWDQRRAVRVSSAHEGTWAAATAAAEPQRKPGRQWSRRGRRSGRWSARGRRRQPAIAIGALFLQRGTPDRTTRRQNRRSQKSPLNVRDSHGASSGYSRRAFIPEEAMTKTLLGALTIAVMLSPAMVLTQSAKSKPTTATYITKEEVDTVNAKAPGVDRAIKVVDIAHDTFPVGIIHL